MRRRFVRPDLDRKAVRYFVYRLHDAEERIVYIGRSCDVRQRLRAHYGNATSKFNGSAERTSWLFACRRVSMVGPFTWEEACKVERREIEAHQPRGNRQHTRAHGWRTLSEGGGRVFQP